MLDPLAPRVAARYLRLVATAHTAESIAKQIESALAPHFKDHTFNVYRHTALGGDSVAVDYFQAPKGSSDLDQWNSKVYVKVSIDAPEKGPQPEVPAGGVPGLRWYKDQPAPENLTATMVRGRGIKFRAKTGKADAVINYVIGWFKANEKALTGK